MERKFMYPSSYEKIGGAETVARLVDAFYRRVAEDPDLKPIFPDDFTEVREKQFRFLTQFFGGPPLYSEVHGHPRLRMRHLPFPITPRRARAWIQCMDAAMEEIGLEEPMRSELFGKLAQTAQFMVNTPEDTEDQQDQ